MCGEISVLEEKLDNPDKKFHRIETAVRELTEKQTPDKASSNKLLIGARQLLLLVYYPQ